MKKLLLSLLFLGTLWIQADACSMFKLCLDGKTLIGNNEDYYDPDTWMWIDKPTEGYGSVYFGYSNFFAQGGMNEKGLVFDGFAMPSMEVKQTKGKKRTDPATLVHQIMRSCQSIDEVVALIKPYNLSFLANAQLMFADRSGNSMILEGDEIVYSPNNYQISTNFYQSQVMPSDYTQQCPRYARGDSMLSLKQESSLEYGTSVLKSMHQSGFWGGTQYSNIYEPQSGKMYLYLFHNFEELVELHVDSLLAKGEHKVELFTLFEERARYDQFRSQYFESQKLAESLEGMEELVEVRKSLERFKELEQNRIWFNQVYQAAESHLKEKNLGIARSIIDAANDIWSNSWEIQALSAKIYYEQKEYMRAMAAIKEAIRLNPDNPELKKARKKIESRI